MNSQERRQIEAEIKYLHIQRELLRRESKKDLLSYIKYVKPNYYVNWHHKEVCDVLMKAWRGERGPNDEKLNRILLVQPPRHGKTEIVSKKFPAWVFGQDPLARVILSTFAKGLTEECAEELRAVMEDRHLEVFPEAGISKASGKKLDWQLEKGGRFFGTTVKGAITGRGFKLGIFDDPVKGHEEAYSPTMRDKVWNWYTNDFYTRCNRNAIIVGIATRWHDDDLLGRLINEMNTNKRADQWYILKHPAINAQGEALFPHAPDHVEAGKSLDELIQIREVLSEVMWNALYQGNPVPDTGTYFNVDNLVNISISDLRDPFGNRMPLAIYGASDFAVTDGDGDYTVHIVVGITPTGDILILDMYREQANSYDWTVALMKMVHKYKPVQWFFEAAQIEQAMLPILEKEFKSHQIPLSYITVSSAKDKPTKARTLQGLTSLKAIKFPPTASFYKDLIDEMILFPRGKNDDMVDTLATLCRGLNILHPPKFDDANIPQRPILTVDAGQPLPEGFRPAQARETIPKGGWEEYTEEDI